MAANILRDRSTRAIELFDVSILLPLPKKESEISLLLEAGESGAKGRLIPQIAVGALPQVVVKKTNEEVIENLMRVVSVRIDPCAKDGVNSPICKKQIRLIWQPVVWKDSKVTTLDASLHSVYELNDSEWSSFWSQYLHLINSFSLINPGAALDIHPEIKNQGLRGEFWKSLSHLTLQHCGEQNLSKLTVMTLEAAEDQWVFVGFDFQNGKLNSFKIPGLFSNGQSFMAAELDTNEFQATIAPINFPEVGLWFFDNSRSAKNRFSEEKFKDWSKNLFEVENPNFHNPGTTDCVSCHVSTNILSWKRRNFPNWNWLNDFAKEKYSSKRNLHNLTLAKSKSNHLRSFGYQGDHPHFSQRLINESAESADLIEAWLKSDYP